MFLYANIYSTNLEKKLSLEDNFEIIYFYITLVEEKTVPKLVVSPQLPKIS